METEIANGTETKNKEACSLMNSISLRNLGLQILMILVWLHVYIEWSIFLVGTEYLT